MINDMLRRVMVGAVLAVVALAGCSGGTNGVAPTLPVSGPPTGSLPQSATVRLVFGGGNSAPAGAGRRPEFVSPSTEGVLAQVFLHGSTIVIASSATDVSPGSGACGGSSSANRACTIIVPAPTGADDFAFTTYDAAPSVSGVAGSFPPSAHVLGTGTLQNQQIASGPNNTLTLYISGVIANIGSATTYVSIPADGAAHTFGFIVDPTDFDNNPIKAGSNDSYANAITATLSETSGSGHLSSLLLNGASVLGSTAVLHESSDALQLTYNGLGTPGYGATVSLSASGATTQTVTISPLYVTSSSPYFQNGSLVFTHTGQQATLQISALNAPSNIIYSASVGSGCANVASVGTATGSGPSANVLVTAGPTSGIACPVILGDSTGTTFTIPASLTAVGGTFTEYPLPTSNAQPYSIATGPDGNLWFTESNSDKIGKITTSGTVTEYAVPTSYAGPFGIAAGPDGNLWFTELFANNIGRITPSGTITEYPIPTFPALPYRIAAGPDGNMWFTEDQGNNIGKITTNGTVTEYPLPKSPSNPANIVAGPDGNLWFTEQTNDAIGKITTNGTITEYAVPTSNANPFGIATGPDGNLWFTESNSLKIGKITTSGVITEFPTSTISQPYSVTAGPDGNLWFTLANGNSIGKITTSGTITEYAVPTPNTDPFGIATGPDGNLWFTESNTDKIGEIIP